MRLVDYLSGYETYRRIKRVARIVPNLAEYEKNVRDELSLLGITYLKCRVKKAKKILPLKEIEYEKLTSGSKVSYSKEEFNKIMKNKANKCLHDFVVSLSELDINERLSYCRLHQETIYLLGDIFQNKMQYEATSKQDIEKILTYLTEEFLTTEEDITYNPEDAEREAIRQRIAFELEFIDQVKGK